MSLIFIVGAENCRTSSGENKNQGGPFENLEFDKIMLLST